MSEIQWWEWAMAVPLIVAGHAALDSWQSKRRRKRMDASFSAYYEKYLHDKEPDHAVRAFDKKPDHDQSSD